MAQIIIPFHRGVNLVYEEYLYKKDRSYGGKQHWRCVTAGCPGRAKADFSDPPLVESSKPHNHIPDEELLRSRKLKASLCVDARATPLASLQQVSVFLRVMIGFVCMMNVKLIWRSFFASPHLTTFPLLSLMKESLMCSFENRRTFPGTPGNLDLPCLLF